MPWLTICKVTSHENERKTIKRMCPNLSLVVLKILSFILAVLFLYKFPDKKGMSDKWLNQCSTICLCVHHVTTRGVTSTWPTGCSTACARPGSPPPNTTWPTSRSSSPSFSTCPNSCSTLTTLTWVSAWHFTARRGRCGSGNDLNVFVLFFFFSALLFLVHLRR